MSNFSLQGSLFISGLSDGEARKLSRAMERSDKLQRGARMPGQRWAGQRVLYKKPVVSLRSSNCLLLAASLAVQPSGNFMMESSCDCSHMSHESVGKDGSKSLGPSYSARS